MTRKKEGCVLTFQKIVFRMDYWYRTEPPLFPVAVAPLFPVM